MLTYRLSITLASGLFLSQNIAIAQVVTDGTAGEGVALEGPDFDIGEELGTRAGDNLFHSFDQFSIDTGESATFSGSTGIENVISRVTGGELSAIDGLIASTIPGASLWLFNPSGVVFGPNASLDVTGSFHVSSADELRTADGGAYSAVNPGANGFSTAAPEAFGFLGADPASITIAGSQLEVGAGETLSVVGGDVDIAGASLTTVGGELNVLAASGAAEANVVTGAIDGASGGSVAVREASSLTSSGDGGGRVRIQGGEFVIDGGSVIASANTGAIDSGVGIDIDSSTIDVTGNSLVITSADGAGDGGDVTLDAQQIRITEGSRVATNTIAEGKGGDIDFAADSVALQNSDVTSLTQAGGDGGAINVVADDTLTLIDGELQTAAVVGSTGEGGDISVVGGAIALRAGGIENTSRIATASLGSGNIGSIDITGESLLLDGENRNGGAAIQTLAESLDSRVGRIRIAVGSIDFRPGGVVLGESDGDDVSAAIDITAGTIVIEGSADALAGITLDTTADGVVNPGTIVVRANNLDIRDGGVISTTTANSSDAGNILISAGNLSLSNATGARASQITSSTTPAFIASDGEDVPASTGDAGEITIIADRIDIDGDGSGIVSTSLGEGDAGTIDIQASDSFRLSGGGLVATVAFVPAGDAGSISIATGDFIVLDGSQITSSTLGAGNAGSIDIVARTGLLDANRPDNLGGIVTQASPGSTGDAGTITLEIDDLILRDEATIASDAFGTGDAGTISIVSDTISIDASQTDRPFLTGITTSADVGAGDAGAIAIVADQLVLLGNNAQIRSTNDGAGAAGTIDLQLTDGLILDSGADVLTASASGGGGGITIDAGRFVSSTGPESRITTTVADDSGDAGDIVVNTPLLALGDSRVLAQADAGRGGDIQISVEDLILSPTAVINAEAGATGVDGTVAVSAPEVDLTGGIVALDGRFLNIASLLRERCAARREEVSSSFTLGTGGSIPADLDAPRLSFLRAGPPQALHDRPQQRTALVLPCPKAAS